jgi:hypothetical protein
VDERPGRIGTDAAKAAGTRRAEDCGRRTKGRLRLVGLIAQQFADIGFVFWGAAWREPMANALDVEVDEIDGWVADPATLPANIETRLEIIGEARMEEIQAFLYLMNEAGISREKPTNG